MSVSCISRMTKDFAKNYIEEYKRKYYENNMGTMGKN